MKNIKEVYEGWRLKYGATKANVFAVITVVGIVVLLLIVRGIYSTGRNVLGIGAGGSGGMSAMNSPYPVLSYDAVYSESYSRESDVYSGAPMVARSKALSPSIVISPPTFMGSDNVAGADRKVIQNGSISMRVERAEPAVEGIIAIAKSYSGFVDSSNIHEVSEGVKAGTVTIRVPGDKFLDAMDEIKKLALKVVREEVTSSDVTAQAIDLDAQIKNLKVEEEQYRTLMTRAGKIEEILNVTQRLSEVRGRIEQIQAQLNYLNRQVAMSTISVNLTAEPEAKIFGIVWRPLTTIKQALRNTVADFAHLTDSAIYFIAGLPVLIIRLAFYLLIIFVGWKTLKFVWNKFFISKQNINQ